jgi:hypothetical protein
MEDTKREPEGTQAPLAAARMEDALAKKRAEVNELQGQDAEDAAGPSKVTAQMSRNELIREVGRLNRVINRADMAGLVERALDKRARLKDVPKLLHAEAFKLMKYVSEGGTETLMIWNSRDGVTPFVCYVRNLKFQHVVGEDMGPYMDRPECDMQWETRTVRTMMEAWHRAIGRALLQGKTDQKTHDRLKDDIETAKKWGLHIGLRDLETGKYTDDY